MTMGVDKHLAHRSRKLRRVGAIMVHARAHGQPARPSRPSARLASILAGAANGSRAIWSLSGANR